MRLRFFSGQILSDYLDMRVFSDVILGYLSALYSLSHYDLKFKHMSTNTVV